MIPTVTFAVYVILTSGTHETTDIFGAYTVQDVAHVLLVEDVYVVGLEKTRGSSMYAFVLVYDDSYVATGASRYNRSLTS